MHTDYTVSYPPSRWIEIFIFVFAHVKTFDSFLVFRLSLGTNVATIECINGPLVRFIDCSKMTLNDEGWEYGSTLTNVIHLAIGLGFTDMTLLVHTMRQNVCRILIVTCLLERCFIHVCIHDALDDTQFSSCFIIVPDNGEIKCV